jgi:SNF2 family DNA or RNA helicase
LCAPIDEDENRMTTTPALDAFQLDTLDFLDRAHGRAIVADPMGARKTGTVLAWLDRQADVQRTLVVAPSAVHGHWEREAARFAPTTSVIRQPTGKAARLDAIERLGNPYVGYPALYVTTYEGMKLEQHQLERAGFDCVVFDEGHKLKGRTTQVALCANSFAKLVPRIIIVTGTPVMNHAQELWEYLHLVAPDVYSLRGASRYSEWAEKHFEISVEKFRNARWPVKIVKDFLPGHEQIVRNTIAPFFIQRDLSEMFPGEAWIVEPEHVEIEVELSAAERKLYDNLVKFKWGLAGSTEIVTHNALDLTTRLTQITSDWDGLSEEKLHVSTKVHAAVEVVADLVKQREEPVVVLCKYKSTVRNLTKLLLLKDVRALSYTGDDTSQVRDHAVQYFASGKIDVLVGTLDSLSEGVDGLQHRCSNVVLVDRHWTPAKNDQAIGRVRRSGQLKQVTVWHIFAANTIDATITAACLRKTNVIAMLKGRTLVDSLYGRV